MTDTADAPPTDPTTTPEPTPPPETPTPTWRDLLPLTDDALLAQCAFDRYQASGPGGQKRNRTASAVRLRHTPTGLHGEASESRSQHENRARALKRLRATIALTRRAPATNAGADRYTPPPELIEAGTARGKLEMGRRDARYLPAIAALFDLLEALEWKVAAAARALGVSTASIGRLLAQDPAVLRAANQRRRALGLHPLRER